MTAPAPPADPLYGSGLVTVTEEELFEIQAVIAFARNNITSQRCSCDACCKGLAKVDHARRLVRDLFKRMRDAPACDCATKVKGRFIHPHRVGNCPKDWLGIPATPDQPAAVPFSGSACENCQHWDSPDTLALYGGGERSRGDTAMCSHPAVNQRTRRGQWCHGHSQDVGAQQEATA